MGRNTALSVCSSELIQLALIPLQLDLKSLWLRPLCMELRPLWLALDPSGWPSDPYS